MPLDPTLSLDVPGGGGANAGQIPLSAQGASGAGPGNALGQFSQLAGIANQMNQLKLFQQQFGARQRAGQIIAASPDIDTAMKGIQQSGDAAFLLPELQYMREMQNTQTQITGQQQSQNQSAMQAAIKATAVANSPADFDKALQFEMQSLPPDVLKRNLPALMSYRESVLGGVTNQQEFDRNRLARLAGAGVTMDTIHQLFGTPTQVQQGNQVTLGNVNPITGGMTPAGSFGVGSPAGIRDVEGVPTPLPAVSAGGRMGGGEAPAYAGAPNPLLGGLPNPSEAGPKVPVPGPVSWLGTPMQIGQSPVQAKSAGVLGLNVLSGPQAEQNNELIKDYSTTGKVQFDAANQTLGSLQTLDKAYDNLVSSGGKFLTPGSLADARLALAKGINTISQIIGKDVPIDASKVATAEDFNKVAGQLVAAATKQGYGASHVAAETVQSVAQTIPQLSNSYLGGKLLVSGLQATAQRIIDQRKFEQAWMDNNQGSLINADNEFNKQFPAEKYADKVLDQFGMTSSGKFKSPQDIGQQVRAGYLTPSQAAAIAREQFPDQFK